MTPLNFLHLTSLAAELHFLGDFFKYKNLHDGFMFSCSKEVAVASQKMFFERDIRIASFILNGEMVMDVPKSSHRVGIVVNSSCENWNKILDCTETGIHFQFPFIWIFVTEDLNATMVELSKYPIDIDADATVVCKTKTGYDLYEVFNTGFHNNGVFKTNFIGIWNYTLKVMKRQWRNDLSGVVLKSAVVVLKKLKHETFEHYLTHNNHLDYDSLHKLKYITLLCYLKDMYNLTYHLLRTNSWGYIRNGSFDGMVGTLQRKESDIGGSPVYFRSDRNELIDYTAQVWHSRHSFIFRHPKHPSGFYTIYTRPLSTVVWFCIVVLLLFTAIVLCMMFKVYLKRSSADSSLSLALLCLWGALCQQGISLLQQSTSIKILIFTTFVYSALLYQYYTASVVSTLLMEAPKNIKTLKDLLDSNLGAGVEEALYDRDYFKRTTDPVALEIYSKKIKQGNSENFFTPEMGMAMVKKGGFAFHVDTIISYGVMKKTFSEREICETQDVPMYAPHRLGAIMKKHSPHRDHLAYGVRKMLETGLMNRIKLSWDEPRPPCVKTPDSSIYSVSMLEFSTPLIILVFGYWLSCLVLILEVFFFYVVKYERKRNRDGIDFVN